MKTTIQHQRIKARDGETIGVQIDHSQQEAIASDGSFAVAPGQLAFSPGSSGWTNVQGEETRWMELFLRSGNAWELFGRPSVGAHIQIR